MTTLRALLTLLPVCGLLFFSSCKRAEPAAAAPSEKRYPLTGEILAIDPEKKILTVAHDEIKNFMPAMTMEFNVTPGDIANARVGQRVRGDLMPRDEGGFLLDRIWPLDPVRDSAVAASTNALNQDTVAKGRAAYREVGEAIPSFTLYDQTGAVVSTDRFRGKQIVLNFIFTRCPVPEMCPAAVARFTQLQAAARAAGITNLELVSITFDTEYDTPGVLRTYADARGLDTTNWTFLTGPEPAMRSLLIQFGILAEASKEKLINHTMRTVLIDENGRILHNAHGAKWTVDEFVGRLKKTP